MSFIFLKYPVLLVNSLDSRLHRILIIHFFQLSELDESLPVSDMFAADGSQQSTRIQQMTSNLVLPNHTHL